MKKKKDGGIREEKEAKLNIKIKSKIDQDRNERNKTRQYIKDEFLNT